MKKKLLTLLITSVFISTTSLAVSLSCEAISDRDSICELIGVTITDNVSWSTTGNLSVSGGTFGARVHCSHIRGVLNAAITHANGTSSNASKSIGCKPSGVVVPPENF